MRDFFTGAVHGLAFQVAIAWACGQKSAGSFSKQPPLWPPEPCLQNPNPRLRPRHHLLKNRKSQKSSNRKDRNPKGHRFELLVFASFEVFSDFEFRISSFPPQLSSHQRQLFPNLLLHLRIGILRQGIGQTIASLLAVAEIRDGLAAEHPEVGAVTHFLAGPDDRFQ